MKLASFEAIVQALNNAGVRFIVVGGIAVIAHGYGRNTQDVDLVIQLEPESIARAFSALASVGYLPRVPSPPRSLPMLRCVPDGSRRRA